jgi:hypothetical protein
MPDLNENTTTAVVAKTLIKIPTEKYVSTKAASGAKSQHNGDPVASLLAGQPVLAVFAIAAAMGTVTSQDLQDKYAHLNVGQQRMNLGNRIRGSVNKMDKAVDKDAALGDKAKGDLVGGLEYLTVIVEGFPLPEPEPEVAVASPVEGEPEAEAEFEVEDEAEFAEEAE